MLKMDRCAMTFQTVKRSFVIVFYQIEIVALLDVGFPRKLMGTESHITSQTDEAILTGWIRCPLCSAERSVQTVRAVSIEV